MLQKDSRLQSRVAKLKTWAELVKSHQPLRRAYQNPIPNPYFIGMQTARFPALSLCEPCVSIHEGLPSRQLPKSFVRSCQAGFLDGYSREEDKIVWDYDPRKTRESCSARAVIEIEIDCGAQQSHMSSPKKMGYMGKSAVVEEELHGEEFQHASTYRGPAQAGFDLIAPQLFPEAEDQASSLYARGTQFDSETLVNATIANVQAHAFPSVSDMGLGRRGRAIKPTSGRAPRPRLSAHSAASHVESDDIRISPGAKADLSPASFLVEKQPFQTIKRESPDQTQKFLDPKSILEEAIKLAVKIHAPNEETGSKRKRTNYSVMSAAEERVAREKSKKRRASLKCKREKIRRTTLNTLMDEIRKELGLPQETVDQANILSHALSYIRANKSSTGHPAQGYR